ncbi:MAG: redox-sensing transcriptional repressor Rex [Chitinivibrionales bacterium]|nr:redox-sensing transcriptional repressor Rex [Chitinivibrionales bacterium]
MVQAIMKKEMPKPTIERLCLIYGFLEDLLESGKKATSSVEIGEMLGIGAHSVRKDINFLGEIGNTKQGYEVEKLKNAIGETLGLEKPRNTCIVGLGKLGTAILNNLTISDGKYRIMAGFDSNINKVETMKAPVDLYPAYEMENIIKQKQIELAILSVSADAAQETAENLIESGIKGIVNFAPVVIHSPRPDVSIRNLDITGELRLLSAYIETKTGVVE